MILSPLQGIVVAAFGAILAAMALGFVERRRFSLCLLLTSFLVGEFLTFAEHSVEQMAFEKSAGRTSITLWQDCVNKSPQKLRSRVNHAYARQLNGELELAMGEYRNAGFLTFQSHLDPDEAKAGRSRVATALGDILVSQNQFEEAGRILANAWNQDPGFPGLGANLAVVLLHDNRPDLALMVLERTIDGAIRYAWFRDLGSLYFNESVAYAMLGRCDEAEAAFEYAKHIDPDSAAWTQRACNQK